MKFKKIQSLFLAAALVCSMCVSPVYADPSQSDLEGQKEDAQNELTDLQTELNTLIIKASELETELINTGQEITQAEADLEAAEVKKEEQYESMKLRIKYMYESGSGTATMEKVLTSGSISDMLSQAEYSQKVHEYDRTQLQAYADTITEIEDLQSTLETEMKNLKETEAEYESQQAVLTETISSKKDEISNLDEMIQEAARKAEEQRKAAEAAAAEKDKTQNNTGTSAGAGSGGTASGGAASGGTTSGGASSGRTSSGGGTSSGGNTGNSGGSPGYTEPSYDTVTGNAVVDRAYEWLGKAEYSMGACSPGLFDCSGFVAYCLTGQYQRLGNTFTFLGWPQVSNPQPGDVCVNTQHCGIYIGNGQMIHCADYGIGVIIGPVQSGMIYVRY